MAKRKAPRKPAYQPVSKVAVEPVSVDVEIPVVEETKEIQEEADPEIHEKYYEEEWEPTYGATSFETLDAARLANEKASEMKNLSRDLRRIIDNILWDDMIEDKAAAITKAASDFQMRLQQAKETPIKALANKVMKLFGKKEKKELEPLIVLKDNNGDWRWVGVFTNNFEDRSKEILTSESHKEFVDYLDAHPDEAPVLCPWHTLAAARKNRADFWDYDDSGFMLVSGILEEEEAQSLLKTIDIYDLGMSHGFYPLAKDSENPNHYTKYRSFEVSYLPVEFADNPWTTLDVIQKENLMNPDKEKFLKTALGEEVFQEVKGTLDKSAETLKALGVKSKEALSAEDIKVADDEPAVPAAQEEPAPAVEEVKASADIEKIAKDLGLPELSEFLAEQRKEFDIIKDENEAMKQQLGELTKSSDQRIAEAITPPNFIWFNRASQSKDTELNEEDEGDQELKDSNPAAPQSWLSDIAPQPK